MREIHAHLLVWQTTNETEALAHTLCSAQQLTLLNGTVSPYSTSDTLLSPRFTEETGCVTGRQLRGQNSVRSFASVDPSLSYITLDLTAVKDPLSEF